MNVINKLAAYGLISLLMLSVDAKAEIGILPDSEGNQQFNDVKDSSAPVRYYYQQRNLEVEIVEDTDGSQYAYTISQYASNPLEDGLYVISQEIIRPYSPQKDKLRHGDYVMVILGGRVVNYYTAEGVIY